MTIASSMIDVHISGGFSIKVAQSLRDHNTDDLALLNIYGPLQSIRATWAKLTSRKVYSWELGGNVKLQKDPGHVILKTETPNGWANWTFISRQAIPKLLDPSRPTYCWTENLGFDSSNTPPKSAYPILMATLPFPMLEEWTDYLWQTGLEKRVIRQLRKPTGVTGYKIIPDQKVWREIVQDGFNRHQIYIGEPAPPRIIEPANEPETETPNYIDIYGRKEAIADEQQYDANIEPFQDVTEQHYKWPVYMSREIYWLMKESIEAEGSWTDYKGIWHDILHMSNARYKTISDRRKSCEVIIAGEQQIQTIHQIEIETGPMDYDDPTPCVYVKLASELD
ncbi:hypothetical protein KAR91_72025 [Candidatus Pacearchaeota archaeon]|nr:hypothetical protein [Candidatus Pacearchaeota archaeon]